MDELSKIQINKLIDALAKELKEKNLVQPVEWAKFVKTGTHKERPPIDNDWWYTRSAAILRTVYLRGPIGVSKLRIKYGGKKNRGHKPSHFYKGSGNIIRKILQQLEKSGLLKYVDNNVHKGRITTKQGVELIKEAAKKVSKEVN